MQKEIVIVIKRQLTFKNVKEEPNESSITCYTIEPQLQHVSYYFQQGF